MRRKWVKRMATVLFGSPAALFVIGGVFVNTSDEFGGTHNEKDMDGYARSTNYREGKFHNIVPTDMSMSAGQMLETLVEFIRGGDGRAPKERIKVLRTDPGLIASPYDVARMVWFGHSAFLVQIDGRNILIDPMFGPVPAPHPWLGKARFTDGLPLEIESLPTIDAMLISHDHYDHLDHGSIKALTAKTKEFYVPLGVGAHLRAWGVEAERIHELDWWNEIEHEHLHFAFTPARHFSGRGLTDRFATLWGSWVIQGRNDRIYFSGDGGYGPHFAEIGARYGPFDFAMMECGQYNEKWADIHMMPEETAQAAVDVQAKVMMPIHWGAFTLAMHSWTDPVERVITKADELKMPIRIPMIGEVITVDTILPARDLWWLRY